MARHNLDAYNEVMARVLHKPEAQAAMDCAVDVQLIERIDDLLPQTQCGQCGYGACRPYAEALVSGSVAPNRCPPGGDEGARELANALSVPVLPLDVSVGPDKSAATARIDEQACIGCTLCIAACPVDAIVGAPKFMHTIIAAQCTGCELCVPPCPVDCIAMIPMGRTPGREARRQAALRARARYLARTARLARECRGKERERTDAGDARSKKREAVERAIQRARERLAGRRIHKPHGAQ
jgi:electron transport complex protein RnfB